MSNLLRSLTKEWLSPLTEDCLALTREDIEKRLCVAPISFYKPEEVWVVKGIINPVLKQIQVVCDVSEPHYLTAPNDHVAEEQQVRCYNHAAYLLGGILRELGDPDFDLPRIDSKCFLLVKKNWRHRRAEPTNKPWSFTLQLSKSYRKMGVAYYEFKIVEGSIQGTIGVFYSPEGSKQVVEKDLYDSIYHRWYNTWAELPKFKLNAMRLIARLLQRKTHQLPAPTTT